MLQGIEDFAVITLRGPTVPTQSDQVEESHSEDDSDGENSDGSWVQVSSGVSRKAFSDAAKELEQMKNAFELIARAYSKERQNANEKKKNDKERDADNSETLLENDSLKAKLKTYEEGLQDTDFLHEKSLPFRRLAFRDYIFSRCEMISAGTDGVSLASLSAELTRFLSDPNVDQLPDVPDFGGPGPDERQYVRRLKELKTAIVRFLPQDIPFTVEAALSILKDISPMGAETVRYIENRRLNGVFNARRRMKQLMTHILCLAFHEHILSPFLLGADTAFNAKLHLLHNYMISRGTFLSLQL